MDVLFGLVILIVIGYGIVKIFKFLWGTGIIQKVLSSLLVSLITGGILLATTGDPGLAVGGGLTLALISIGGSEYLSI